jgi:hypothetical protein
MKIKLAWLGGVGMAAARILAPSLKIVGYPRVTRFDLTTQPPVNPNVEPLFDYPIPIQAIEELEFQTDNSNAAAQDHAGVMLLEDVHQPTPPGPSWTIKGTGAVVTSNRVWGSGTITWEDTYRTWLYGVIGIRVVGANVTAARLIPNISGPRPGVIGQSVETQMLPNLVWDGRFGVMTTFRPPVFPLLEVLGNGATATQTVYLQIVKLSE